MQLSRLIGDRTGGVAPLLALLAFPLMASVGAAVDYSRANAARASMQGALDAAALLLAKQAQQLNADQVSQDATTYFNANFTRPDVQNVQVTAAASSSGGTSLTLTATGAVTTQFVGLMGISTISVSVQSGAFASADGLGCVLSLNATASGAATAQGSTSVNLSGVQPLRQFQQCDGVNGGRIGHAFRAFGWSRWRRIGQYRNHDHPGYQDRDRTGNGSLRKRHVPQFFRLYRKQFHSEEHDNDQSRCLLRRHFGQC
jgi:Flp pilus assembly protein TadG